MWWDRGLVAGDQWTDAIRNALDSAGCVVVLWSTRSWSSRWVQAEAELAFNKNNLVAGRLDDVALLPPFNIIQTADLRAQTGPSGMARLIEGVRKKLANADIDRALPLQGQEKRVRLRAAPVGIVLVSAVDGEVVPDRRALDQEILRRVPRDESECVFVNVRTNSGELVSCVIHGPNNDVFGDERAFWWSFARVTLSTTADRVWLRTMGLDDYQMADVCVSAQCAWAEAVRYTPIVEMRNQPIWQRNRHLSALSGMIDGAPTAEAKIGYEMALAMVLATQSEDLGLEGQAFRAFREYLWVPGDEPEEFICHDGRP